MLVEKNWVTIIICINLDHVGYTMADMFHARMSTSALYDEYEDV